MLCVVLAPIRAEEAVQMCFLAYCVGPLVINEHQVTTVHHHTEHPITTLPLDQT